MAYTSHPTQLNNIIDIAYNNCKSADSQLNDNHFLELNKILQENNCLLQSDDILLLHTTQETIRRGEFVQVIFDGNRESGHYICVYCDGFSLRVYDSLNRSNLSAYQTSILQKLLPQVPQIPICYVTVQKQSESYNCGFFAIAFELALAHNICPCMIEFEECKLREEFVDMILQRKMKMFPFKWKQEKNS